MIARSAMHHSGRFSETSATRSPRFRPSPASASARRATCRAVSAQLVGCQSSRSEEHTSELQSLMRISYAVFCLKKKISLHNILSLTISPNNTPSLTQISNKYYDQLHITYTIIQQ